MVFVLLICLAIGLVFVACVFDTGVWLIDLFVDVVNISRLVVRLL